MTVCFIGLGIMGLPMARNLLAADFEVTGYNRSRVRSELLVEHGGRVAGTIAEAVSGAQVVITMLPDGPDVEEVLQGPAGVLENAEQGAVVIDMSTIHPAISRRVAEEAARRGIHVLDAPVSGGEQGAIKGSLSIMVGGDPSTFETALPVFKAMGAKISWVGGHGAGQTVKAANQMIVAVTIGALAEALTMLEAVDVDVAAAVDVLSGGLAGSAVLNQKATLMRERQYSPGFRVALHHKDMGIALGITRDAGVVTPLASIAAQQIASLVAQGHGGLDHSSLKFLVDQLSGRT
jgi:2-hydroxy-3-oxopropionate reductase